MQSTPFLQARLRCVAKDAGDAGLCCAAVSELAVGMTAAPVTNSLCCEEAVPETLKRMVALRWSRKEVKVDCAENTSAVGWTKPSGVGVLGRTADGDSIAVWW